MQTEASKTVIISWVVIVGVLILGFAVLFLDARTDERERLAYAMGYEDATLDAEAEHAEKYNDGFIDGYSQFFTELIESEDLMIAASDFFEAGVNSADSINGWEDEVELFSDYYLSYEFRLLDQKWNP